MRIYALILAADDLEAQSILDMVTSPDLHGLKAFLLEIKGKTPWWYDLKAGELVRPVVDSPPLLFSDGRTRGLGKKGESYKVWEPVLSPDKTKICVFNGPAILGGLWVAGELVEKVA